MRGFWKTVRWAVDTLTKIAMLCLLGMTLVTCVDVVGRFFDRPIFGSVEIVGFMATLAVAMALPYTHQVKGNIGVEIVVRLLSARSQRIIELGTNILSFVLFGLITWRIAIYARTIQKSGEVSMSLEFPEYIIIYVVSFCFFVFFVLILQDIVKNIEMLRGKR
jgi:TRAP-type C4-dicarboxylate transport system permease small subunit